VTGIVIYLVSLRSHISISTSFENLIFGFSISLAILIVKKIYITLLCLAVVKWTKMHTFSKEQVLLSSTLFWQLSYWLVVSNVASGYLHGNTKEAAIYSTATTMVTFLVLEPLFAFFRPFEFIRRKISFYQATTQRDLNAIFEGPEFSLAVQYTNAARYCVDKYICLRVARRCKKYDTTIHNQVYSMSISNGIVLAANQITFLVQTSEQIHAFTYVMSLFAVGFVIALLSWFWWDSKLCCCSTLRSCSVPPLSEKSFKEAQSSWNIEDSGYGPMISAQSIYKPERKDLKLESEAV